MSDIIPITESPTFALAKASYYVAIKTFFRALEAETKRLVKAIVPDATALSYSLRYNEESELKVNIFEVMGAGGVLSLTEVQLDSLNYVEDNVEWLAQLDGAEEADHLAFDVTP